MKERCEECRERGRGKALEIKAKVGREGGSEGVISDDRD